MPAIRRRSTARAHQALLALAGALALATSTRVAAQNLPSRLHDEEFWRLIAEMSEPGGFFRSDNFVSNETSLQYVIPELQRTTKPGGVFLGVAPDQNFTYIVALKPRIAFIVDIRRQAMLQHLMYKAIIEMSADRAEFLSHLFSRPRPKGLDTMSTVEALFESYANLSPDTLLSRKNLEAIKERLVKTHGFTLSDDDLAAITYVYGAFYVAGPDLTYSFNAGRGYGGYGGRAMPTYAQLMLETDGQEHRSYLASEANYKVLREMERDNLVVPLVGNFAGDKALVAVGKYLLEHGATVTAFYTSNVEQYLFQQGDDWKRFYQNVATLPIDAASTFIRSYSQGNGMYRPPQSPNARSLQLLSSIAEQLKAFREGRVQSYYDVIQMSR